MAAKKTNKGKKESRFYIANTMNQAKGKIEEKVTEVNDKYVKKQIDTGKEFLNELKADPVKRIDDLIGDSRKALKKARETRVNTIQEKLESTKKDINIKMETRKKNLRDKLDTISKQTQKIYEGLENDAKLIADDVLEMGRKNLDRLPMKKTIEEKLNAGINAIPSKLNLPSKDEIENLVSGIDGVNKKVDALNKEFAKA